MPSKYKREAAASRAVAPEAARSVYDGRDRLGHFIQRSDYEIAAFDRRGRQLGVFDSVQEASAAISTAARVARA